jgi:CRISPR-associated exonuclease Cas4
MKKVGDNLIIKEVKKSSKFKKSARFQLLYYLFTFKNMGIKAKGELVFPEERKKEKVNLTLEDEKKLKEAIEKIRKIARLPVPPSPKKIKFCRNCAYREYCWPEG